MAETISKALGCSVPPQVAAALDAMARLAREAPALAEVAAVQGALLRAAAAAPPLAVGVALAPAVARAKLAAGVPLLRDEDLGLDRAASRAAMRRLAEAAAAQGLQAAEPVAQMLRFGALEPAELALAALSGNVAAVAKEADDLALDAELVGTLLRFTLFGPLVALAEELAPLREGAPWGHGYCPTCGSWPLLAEERGPGPLRHLRCGLCASAWAIERTRCPFCGGSEQLGYHYAAGPARHRAAACGQCRGYLKVLDVQAPTPPYELPALDLATIALDRLAIAQGCTVGG